MKRYSVVTRGGEDVFGPVWELHDGFIVVGEARTLWVWLPELQRWCIQGVPV